MINAPVAMTIDGYTIDDTTFFLTVAMRAS